jgi:hypothetical protein
MWAVAAPDDAGFTSAAFTAAGGAVGSSVGAVGGGACATSAAESRTLASSMDLLLGFLPV